MGAARQRISPDLAMVLLLCQQMSVSAAASHLGENDTQLWRVFEHYVKEAHAKKDWSQLYRIMVMRRVPGAVTAT